MTENKSLRSKGYMTYLVIFMGLIALTDQYLSLIETSAIGPIIAHFGITINVFLKWQGIFGIAAFLVFLISSFADAVGRKIGILLLILIMSMSALLIGLVGDKNFWAFMGLYAVLILGTNVNLWAIPISEESPPRRRAFNGSMAFLIGLIPLYAFVAEPIINALGWPWLYGLFGIFGFGTIILWFFMKETKRWELNSVKIREDAKIGKQVSRFRQLTKRDWGFILLSGLTYVCWNSAFKIATGTVADHFLGNESYTIFYYMAGGATILGALTIGILMDKVGRIFAFIFSSVGAAVGYVLLAVSPSSSTTGLIGMVAVYFFMSCFLGFLLVYISEMFSTKVRATAVGFSLTLSRIGYVIGPFIASWIAPHYTWLYLVAAVIALLPLLSLFFNKYESKGKQLETIETEVNL